MIQNHRIIATTLVAADPGAAFAVFTEEVDSWWKRGPRFRPSLGGAGVLHFEPGVDGRLVETYEDGTTFEFGRVKIWEPGRRLIFDLIARNFQPGESTEVEVNFEAAGEDTRVTIEHRGWDRFPKDHPARHGLDESAFSDVMGVWWADLLVAVKARVSAHS